MLAWLLYIITVITAILSLCIIMRNVLIIILRWHDHHILSWYKGVEDTKLSTNKQHSLSYHYIYHAVYFYFYFIFLSTNKQHSLLSLHVSCGIFLSVLNSLAQQRRKHWKSHWKSATYRVLRWHQNTLGAVSTTCTLLT